MERDHDVAPDVRAMQTAIWQRMSPMQKLAVAGALYRSARQLSEAGFRMRHPAASDAEVSRMVARAFLLSRA